MTRRPSAVAVVGLAAGLGVAVAAGAAGFHAALGVATTAAALAFAWALVLTRSLARYRTNTRSFFDAAGDAVLLLAPETERILDANAAACELYGYARGEIVGMSARTFSDDPTAGEDATRRLLAAGGTVQFDSTHRRRDGAAVRVRVRATLTRIGGRPVLVSVNRDVTDEEWFADELARQSRELQAVADNAQHLIVRLDTELRYQFVNRAVTELMGLSGEAFIGKTAAEAGLSAEDIATWEPPLRTALASGTPGEFEFTLTAAEGPRTLVCVVVPERAACDGPVVSLLCVSRDVTDERRVEAELDAAQTEAARLARVLAQTADGVIVTDTEGRAVWVNEGATRISGYAEAEILGERPAALMAHPETDPDEVARVARGVAAQEPFTAELLNRRRDGRPYWVRISCTPLVEGGQFAGYVAIETDITEERAAEAALRESEARFQTLLDAVDDVIWAAPLDGSAMLFVSAAAEQVYGRPHAEIVADPAFWASAVHPDDRAAVEAASASLFETGSLELEYRIVRPDGTVRWVRDRKWVVRDAAGEPVRLGGIATDVTARREARAALALQEERFRNLVHHSSDVVSILDAGGQILYESPAVEGVLGYAPEDLVGRSAFDFLHPDDVDGVAAAFAGAAQTPGRSVPVSFRWRHADGRWVDIEAVGTNRLADPSVGGIVVNSRDVGANLRYAEEREARQRAEEMLRLKTAFLSNMSHEIRTPLTAILGYSEILVDEAPDGIRDLAVAVRSGGERLMATLNAVLDLAQIEAGELVPRPEPLDVGGHLCALVQRFRPLAEAKGLALTLDVALDLPRVSVDAGLLDRVVTNLVGNAVKFTDRGAVGLRARYADGALRLSVVDTGVGIAPGDVERMFDPFTQASEGPARTHEGIGLGLAIVRDVVALMGGEVSVESVLGEGSRIDVTVPAPDTRSTPGGINSPESPVQTSLAPVD